MKKMGLFLFLFLSPLSFAGQWWSRPMPILEQREEKQCSFCEKKDTSYIAPCTVCGAIMCATCEKSCCFDGVLLYSEKKHQFFVGVLCDDCDSEIRLYGYESEEDEEDNDSAHARYIKQRAMTAQFVEAVKE